MSLDFPFFQVVELIVKLIFSSANAEHFPMELILAFMHALPLKAAGIKSTGGLEERFQQVSLFCLSLLSQQDKFSFLNWAVMCRRSVQGTHTSSSPPVLFTFMGQHHNWVDARGVLQAEASPRTF